MGSPFVSWKWNISVSYYIPFMKFSHNPLSLVKYCNSVMGGPTDSCERMSGAQPGAHNLLLPLPMALVFFFLLSNITP